MTVATFEIPFLHRARILRPRARNPEEVAVIDFTPVVLPVHDDAILACIYQPITDDDGPPTPFYAAAGTLWAPAQTNDNGSLGSQVADPACMLEEGRRWAISTRSWDDRFTGVEDWVEGSRPFCNIEAARFTRREVPARKWLWDDREEMAGSATHWAETQLALIEGQLCFRTRGPAWCRAGDGAYPVRFLEAISYLDRVSCLPALGTEEALGLLGGRLAENAASLEIADAGASRRCGFDPWLEWLRAATQEVTGKQQGGGALYRLPAEGCRAVVALIGFKREGFPDRDDKPGLSMVEDLVMAAAGAVTADPFNDTEPYCMGEASLQRLEQARRESMANPPQPSPALLPGR